MTMTPDNHQTAVEPSTATTTTTENKDTAATQMTEATESSTTNIDKPEDSVSLD